MPGGAVAGLDLDGLDTTESDTGHCRDRYTDFVSPLDPDERGVDNAVADRAASAGLIPGSGVGEPSLPRFIRSGQFLLVVAITDIDSLDDDDEVSIEVHRVQTASCLPTDPSSCIPVSDTRGLARDQRFVATASLGASSTAAIVGGRLRGPLPDVLLPLGFAGSIDDATATIRLHAVQIDIPIREGARVTGVAGAAITTSDFAAAVVSIDPTLDLDDAVRALAGISDLEPSADGSACASLSLGVEMSMVPCTMPPGE